MDDRQQLTAAHYRPAIPTFRDVWAPILAVLAGPLLEKLPLGAAPRRLEIGCGPGLLLDELRHRAPAGALTIGGDILTEMLAEARVAAPAIPLVRLDAARLPFRGASFDLVVSTFTWHHLREQHRALAEVLRVLRPGGHFGLATWARDEGRPGCRALELWEDLLQDSGAPENDPEAPPVSTEAIDTPRALAALLVQSGFGPVEVSPFTARWTWRVDDLLRYLTGMGESRRRLERIPPARRAGLIRKARAGIERMSGEERTWRPVVLLAVARRGPTVDDEAPAAGDYRTICPNCGTIMYDRGCKTRCPKCHYFTDCSDPW